MTMHQKIIELSRQLEAGEITVEYAQRRFYEITTGKADIDSVGRILQAGVDNDGFKGSGRKKISPSQQSKSTE